MTESDRGLQIRDVVRGSAAARAGLRAGDIILRAAGRDVSDPRGFVQQIQGMEQGDDFGLTVLRDGSETELNASLEASDTQRMAKPAMDGDRSPEAIRQEIQRLEQELERMESQGEGQSDDAWSGDRDSTRAQESIRDQDSSGERGESRDRDATGDRSEGSSDIQSRQERDGSPDDDATRSRSSGDADASISTDDEGARGEVGAEARTETDADVETDATESAPQPGELNRDLNNRSDDATEEAADQSTDASLNDLFDSPTDSSDN